MRLSRLVVAAAAVAMVLPAGLATAALADDASAGGGTSAAPQADNPPGPPSGMRGPGGPQLTDEQRTCMEGKGFARPQFQPGERPERPSREEMEKKRAERMAAAKECGLPERPPGMHRGPGGPGGPGGGHMRRSPLTEEQRSCMEGKGFGRPSGERGAAERPSREEMDKRRDDFKAAAEACGLPGRGAPREAHPQPPAGQRG